MYSQRCGIVQREVKGPTPKVVMVVSSGRGWGIPHTPTPLAEPVWSPAGAPRGGKLVPDTMGLSFEKMGNFPFPPLPPRQLPYLDSVFGEFLLGILRGFSLGDTQKGCPRPWRFGRRSVCHGKGRRWGPGWRGGMWVEGVLGGEGLPGVTERALLGKLSCNGKCPCRPDGNRRACCLESSGLVFGPCTLCFRLETSVCN